MKKKRAILTGVILGACVLLIAADYFALFGTSRKEQLELIELNFVMVDEETGETVTGVHARCFQSNNKNACAERNSGAPGMVSISVPVTKVVTKSLLFVQDSTMRETADPKLKIMFIHPDYANPVESILVSDLPAQATDPVTITMPRSIAGKY